MSTYQSEYIKCGKPGCRKCPHGPYWYEYYTEDGRRKKKYHGKADPRRQGEYDESNGTDPSCRLDDILCTRTASLALACEILGVSPTCTTAQVLAAFRRQAKLLHPDRGGNEKAMKYLNAAWAYWRSAPRG